MFLPNNYHYHYPYSKPQSNHINCSNIKNDLAYSHAAKAKRKWWVYAHDFVYRAYRSVFVVILRQSQIAILLKCRKTCIYIVQVYRIYCSHISLSFRHTRWGSCGIVAHFAAIALPLYTFLYSNDYHITIVGDSSMRCSKENCKLSCI